jgi:predicted small secreted protein
MRTTNIVKRIAPLTATLTLALCAGCNTVAGAGKDLQAGGKVVQDAAQSVGESIGGKK